MLTGVEFLLPSVPLGGVGSYSAAGSICPNLCTAALRRLHRRRMAARARAAIQDDAALAPLQRPVPVVAQGRHGDHGPSGRPDASAAADRHQGAPGLHRAASSTTWASSTPSRTAGDAKRKINDHIRAGLVHTPVTPFTRDQRIDFDALRQAASTSTSPTAPTRSRCRCMSGESVSLTDVRAARAARIRDQAGRGPRAGHRARERCRHRHRRRPRAPRRGRRRRRDRRHDALLLDAAAGDAASSISRRSARR